MMRGLVAGFAACVLLVLPATAAEFRKSYAVEGTDPGGGGGGAYAGTVAISKTGDAVYQVVWTIAGEKFVGTGIGSPEGLAVAYKSGPKTGIAIYQVNPNGDVDGYWTYAGGTEVGRETWTAR